MRHRSRFGSDARARAAAVLLLTLRGAPYLYAGEELGLADAEIPPGRVVDPGGRDGCRAPIPWDASPGHGWPVTDPWLPWPPDADRLNVFAEQADPASMLHLYRRLLLARRSSDALRAGGLTLLDGLPDGVLGYERVANDPTTGATDRRVVLLNFTAEPVPVSPGSTGAASVEVSSDGRGEGAPLGATLGPDQAVILRP
jgi:alpha-glucosidase